ncbi:hypothetical protein M0Q50_06340 [bacterium]|jgi:hypothetical protein|nr:hypothetical protein [bacterium]
MDILDKSRKTIPLISITWDDIKPDETVERPAYPSVPSDSMSSTTLRSEDNFNQWHAKFIKFYGSEGDLILDEETKWGSKWKIINNPKFNDAINAKFVSMSDYYKSNAKYQGD